MLLSAAQRNGAVTGLSRAANAGSSTRKQLQYYESTPTQVPPPRKHPNSVLKGSKASVHLNNSASNSNNLLDVTGQNVVGSKVHGKSSAYLPNPNSLAELHWKGGKNQIEFLESKSINLKWMREEVPETMS